MNPKASNKFVIFRITIFAFIAFALTRYTFSKPTNEESNIGYYVLGGVILVFILNAIKSRFPPKIRNLINHYLGLFNFIDLITHELIENRVGLILVVVLLGLFIGMEQAQELLLHLSQNPIAPPIFFLLLIILALSSWYWTRFTYKKNVAEMRLKTFFSSKYKFHREGENAEVSHIRGVLPKLIGLLIILIPTFFILKLYLNNVTEDHYLSIKIGTFFTFWMLLIILYSFLKVTFYEYIKDLLSNKKWILWSVLIALAIITIVLGVTPNKTPRTIPYLFLSGGVVAVLYFLFASMKIENIVGKLRFFRNKNVMHVSLFISSILVICAFILYNIDPLFIQINGLIILLAALIFYSFLAYVFLIFGRKIKLPLLTFIIVITTIWSVNYAPKSSLHDVRLVDTDFQMEDRVLIGSYTAQWLAKNDTSTFVPYKEQNKKIPIIFISTEGGGSRAAFWTLLLHDTLESTIKNYYSHIFSMSGASGGNTGNSFYLAYREYVDEHKTAEMAESVFKNDFVSTDIGLLFGRDAWQSSIAQDCWDDRSEYLQQNWEGQFANFMNKDKGWKENPLKKDFLSFWYEKGELRMKHPLFLLHTTHVQSGDHATMSAVSLLDFIPQNMDLLKTTNAVIDGKSIPLSSGALLNSRFPIVCPSGKIPDVGNFVDAGYYDNFGASETRAAMNAFIKFLENSKKYNRNDYQLVHLVFRNGLPDKDIGEYVMVRSNKSDTITKEKYKLIKEPAESMVPLSALSGAAFAHPNRELAEAEYVADRTIYFDLKRTSIMVGESQDPITPIIPLSRHLSEYSRDAMRQCLKEIITGGIKDSLETIFIGVDQ